ncbi:MAG: WD40 repeat domain-containing protein, partial [Gemmataceae bacterium]
ADGLVWLWDTKTADPTIILIEAADGCTLEGVAYHPDGEHVVVGGIDYLSTGERTGAVCVWHLPSKLKAMEFDIGVYAVAIDHSGRFIAGAGLNGSVFLWDTRTQEQIFELPGHNDKIHTVVFSPDGSYVISTGDEGSLRIWDVLSGRLMVEREFDTAIQSLVFSPCGKYVYTGNSNTTCYELEFAILLDD